VSSQTEGAPGPGGQHRTRPATGTGIAAVAEAWGVEAVVD
jgi:hypothetical protein